MAASISGSHHSCCYSSAGMARGSRRCSTIIRSSYAPCSPASCKPSTTSARIGRKWAELQGARDWAGLLSPLDGALRGELVRYGAFVRAAYASFEDAADARAPSYGSCRFPTASLLRRAGLPETGYRVTRILHAAASSTSAPRWLSSSCSSSSSSSSSYIGFVAVCDDEEEIERLGRRDVVVAFRGTATRGEWVDNLQSSLTRLPPPHGGSHSHSDAAGEEEEEEEPMVERGFWRLFTAPGEAHSSLQEQVRGEVERIVQEYGGDNGTAPLSVTITGHSLGAALAVLTAYEITTSATQQDAAPMVTAVSFGGPRVGNAAFRRKLEESGCKVLRIVNSNDIVTKVPGFPVDDDERVSSSSESSSGNTRRRTRVPRWLVAKMGWAYSDVGRELRLCSEDSASSNVVASHDLDLYLKLVAAA